jgi:hypothetical protein
MLAEPAVPVACSRRGLAPLLVLVPAIAAAAVQRSTGSTTSSS